MILWTAIHLPDFSLQVFLRGAEQKRPFAVTGPRGVLLACNAEAQVFGIRAGMKLSAAQALLPTLETRERDLKAEFHALSTLAQWCGQWASSISLAPPHGVLIETGGSVKFFGGIDKLTEYMREGLQALGYDNVIASAPTAGAAMMLARGGVATAVTEPGQIKARLRPLPLEVLDYESDVLDALMAMGVRSVGGCLQLPRSGLARRFGPALVDELDRALGELPDPRKPFNSPAHFASRLELPSSVEVVEQLVFGLRRLLAELTAYLAPRSLGVTRLTLELLHDDEPATTVTLGLSASRDGEHLLRVMRERLSRVDLPQAVVALRIAASETANLDAQTMPLIPGERNSEKDRAELIERLRARLGDTAVTGIEAVADHRPERALRDCEPGKSMSFSNSRGKIAIVSKARAGAVAAPCALTKHRPLWLLPRPQRLHSRASQPWLDGQVSLIAGPERIASGWWDDTDSNADTTRDYFVARAADGETLWIYRHPGADNWYLHGIFS
jgi:protein ImuB